MSDDELKQAGVSKFGDRIAIVTFAKKLSNDDLVIDRIKNKLSKTKKSWTTLNGNKNASKQKRKIELGWMKEDPLTP